VLIGWPSRWAADVIVNGASTPIEPNPQIRGQRLATLPRMKTHTAAHAGQPRPVPAEPEAREWSRVQPAVFIWKAVLDDRRHCPFTPQSIRATLMPVRAYAIVWRDSAVPLHTPGAVKSNSPASGVVTAVMPGLRP
ncbi:MAG: hypothetical protein NT154_17615, partial [Verrucomicrobia bacterium]|nr:hypothetical protein [Verrucomicrobiota bacterium]